MKYRLNIFLLNRVRIILVHIDRLLWEFSIGSLTQDILGSRWANKGHNQ
jgi:hypothetical protein